jgi:hypothetical protein
LLPLAPPSTRSSVMPCVSPRSRQHGLEQGGALEGNAFQRGAGDMGDAAAARQAEDGAARIGLPIGRAEAGEGRDEDHAAAVGHAAGQCLDVGAAPDGLQAVAQPLHHGAADEDAAFQRISWRRLPVCAALVAIRPLRLRGSARRCAST